MSGAGRAVVLVAGVVIMLLGMSGRLMPHEWLGISPATLIGWGIAYIDRIVGLVLLIVIMDRQRQLNGKLNRLAWRLGDKPPERRGAVVPFRRRSG